MEKNMENEMETEGNIGIKGTEIKLLYWGNPIIYYYIPIMVT